MLLAAFAMVTVPLKYPYGAYREMMDSGVVAGLIVPVAAMARVLDEGAPYLVHTAARRLALDRAVWAAGFLIVAGLAATAMATAMPVSRELVVADAVLLAGAALVGVSLLGGDVGWPLPLVLVGIASTPGLVPWNLNLLYRHTMSTTRAGVALGVALLGILLYTWRGSVGPAWRNRIRRADAQLGSD